MDVRIKLYRKIEVGRKQLAYMQDEDVFRDFLRENIGKHSRKDMTVKELERLVSLLGGAGATFTAPAKKRAAKKTDEKVIRGGERSDFLQLTSDMPFYKEKRQMLAIWRKLGYNLASLDTRVKRAFGVDAFVWLKEGEHIRTLLSDLQRREKAFDKKAHA